MPLLGISGWTGECSSSGEHGNQESVARMGRYSKRRSAISVQSRHLGFHACQVAEPAKVTQKYR
jgi:hypothetical protein